MSSHAAAGSAAGYLYQCERALLELVERSRDRVTLFMEKVDDIHLEANGLPIDVLQLKHHVVDGAELSDSSPDLWRTIAVWVDVLDDLEADESPIFTLMTTSTAPVDSAAKALAAGPRDVDEALAKLETAARSSENEATRRARETFISLDPGQRLRLVASMRVRAGEPRLADLDERLASLLSLHVMLPGGRAVAFLDRLKGWWYGRCVLMLTTGSGITSSDLAAFIADLRDRFHPDDLPPDFDLADPTESEIARYHASVFVQQLLWIAYSNDQLLDAVRDYHRAFTQRSKWARQGLIYPGELDQYERRLVEQWRRVFHDMVTELTEGASDTEQELAGRRLLQSLRDNTAVRLRDRYHDVMLTHGTLHHLANEREVGWHPEFQKRLEDLLTGAA